MIEVGDCFLERVVNRLEFFFGFELFFESLSDIFDHLKIGEDELEVDDFDVVDRIDFSGDVDDIAFFEAADDMDDGIGFADVREEFVPKAFSFGSAFDEACDVNESDSRGNKFLLSEMSERICEAGVADFDDADVRIDGAERIVGDSRCSFPCQGVKKSRFSDIGESDDAA